MRDANTLMPERTAQPERTEMKTVHHSAVFTKMPSTPCVVASATRSSASARRPTRRPPAAAPAPRRRSAARGGSRVGGGDIQLAACRWKMSAAVVSAPSTPPASTIHWGRSSRCTSTARSIHLRTRSSRIS